MPFYSLDVGHGSGGVAAEEFDVQNDFESGPVADAGIADDVERGPRVVKNNPPLEVAGEDLNLRSAAAAVDEAQIREILETAIADFGAVLELVAEQ